LYLSTLASSNSGHALFVNNIKGLARGRRLYGAISDRGSVQNDVELQRPIRASNNFSLDTQLRRRLRNLAPDTDSAEKGGTANFQSHVTPESAVAGRRFHIDDQFIAFLERSGDLELERLRGLLMPPQQTAVQGHHGRAVNSAKSEPHHLVRVQLPRQAETAAKAGSAGEIRQAAFCPAARHGHSTGRRQLALYHLDAAIDMRDGAGQRLTFPGAAQTDAMWVHDYSCPADPKKSSCNSEE
jgi:hypothetical protein